MLKTLEVLAERYGTRNSEFDQNGHTIQHNAQVKIKKNKKEVFLSLKTHHQNIDEQNQGIQSQVHKKRGFTFMY